MPSNKILALVVTSMTMLLAPTVKADVVYPLIVEKSKGKQVKGIVTKVNDTHFITDSQLLNKQQRLVIVDDNVSPSAQVIAKVVAIDEENRFAILQASNVSGNSIELSIEEQELGETVVVKTLAEEIPSIVQDIRKSSSINDKSVYVHQGLYKEGQWAAPLLNNCQQLIGMNVATTSFLSGLEVPEESAFAIKLGAIKSLLTKNAVSFKAASTVCLSEQEAATARAEKAEAEKLEIEKAAAQAKADAEKAKQKQDEINIAKQKADELAAAEKKKAEQAAKEKEQADKDKELAKQQQQQAEENLKKANEEKEKLAKQKAEAEELAKSKQQSSENAEQQKLYYIAGFSVLVLILLIVFLRVNSKRKAAAAELSGLETDHQELATDKKELEKELAEMQRTFNDILLDGATADGNPIRIKINGNALAVSNQQLLGRESSKVDYTLAEGEISRIHLKLLLKDEQLLVEDQGSQNGTWVNNEQILPGQQIELSDGSTLRLSSIEFKVQYLKS